MQLSEVVAGHRSVHVVLCVVIHAPVQKTKERIQDNGPGAQSKIRHVILETHMLRVIAEILEPAPVKWGQCNQDWNQPEVEIQRNNDYQYLKGKMDASPIEQTAP